MHVHGDDRHLRRDGESEGRVLERQQLARAAPRALGKYHNGRAPTNHARRFIIRFEGALASRPIDRDVSYREHGPSQDGNPKQFSFCDETDGAGQRREECPDVEHRGMIRRVHDGLVSRNLLQARRDDRCAGGAEDIARPIRAAPVVHAAHSVLDAQQPRDDRGRCVQNCGEEKNDVIPERADHRAK